MGYYPQDSLTKTLYAPLLSPIRLTCHFHFILLDLITRILVRSADDKAARYVLFSAPPLPRPSYTQISSPAPYSRHPKPMFQPRCEGASTRITPSQNEVRTYNTAPSTSSQCFY
jgi:hypothetical protein